MNKTAIFLAVVSIIGFVVSNNLTSHGGDVEDMIGSFLFLGSLVLFIISIFLFISSVIKNNRVLEYPSFSLAYLLSCGSHDNQHRVVHQ